MKLDPPHYPSLHPASLSFTTVSVHTWRRKVCRSVMSVESETAIILRGGFFREAGRVL